MVKNGRAGVDPGAADLQLAHLAARPGGPLDHDHLEAAGGQAQRRHEPPTPAPTTTTRSVLTRLPPPEECRCPPKLLSISIYTTN
jgi:hypothetical protein